MVITFHLCHRLWGETGDPEAAAAVFENGDRGCGGVHGACNGLHMSPSLMERVRRDRLPVYICGLLLSLITRAGKLSHVRAAAERLRLLWRYGHGGEGGWYGGQIFHVVFSACHKIGSRSERTAYKQRLSFWCRATGSGSTCATQTTHPHIYNCTNTRSLGAITQLLFWNDSNQEANWKSVKKASRW